jgi:5-methylcytosine-specific restriction endonuclease McrA
MKEDVETKRKLIERDGLRCSVTGESVERMDQLSIEHIIPLTDGGGLSLDNLILVKSEFNSTLSAIERKRARLLFNEIKERQEELGRREKSAFDREQAYRKQLEVQQTELESARHQIRKEQIERESMYQSELEVQRRGLHEQQVRLKEQFKASENSFNEQLKLLEKERENFANEIQKREKLLQMSFEELEMEKRKYTEESRQKIERSSSAYVNEALTALAFSSNRYHAISRNWSLLGLTALLGGVGAAIYFGLSRIAPMNEGTSIDWPQVIFFGFKGIVIVVLFIAISKYCFSYSQSFMHESLKNSERKHAINFGKFYLQSYGANAEWGQVKEAFEHWNIAPSSAFSKADADSFDPHLLERASQFLESVGKLRSAKDEGSRSNKEAEGKG